MRATLFAMRHALFSILRQVVQVICPQLIVGILADAVGLDFETGFNAEG